MTESERQTVRRLSAILSTDVVGYSRLMSDDERATIKTITACRTLFEEQIVNHNGRVVDATGDNILAEFASAVDAVNCAVVTQKKLTAENAEIAPQRQMHFRIGINIGDIIVDADRIYGDGVNIAARIESLADSGGICIADNVFDQVSDKLELQFESLGPQELKNITRPVTVHRVVSSTHQLATSPPSIGASVSEQTQELPSIAVLPFQNKSDEQEQEYFSDGLTEDLITDLSKISGLLVIAQNSVFTYKNVPVRADAVGHDLGVRYIVEGSVRKAGNRVRITVQLIDTATDVHLWADRYDGSLDDIFALQDSVVQQIVLALTVKLTDFEQARIGKSPTNNMAAYDAFMRGRDAYKKRGRSSNLVARAFFEQAIELDNEFAQAYAFLGRTYLQEFIHQWSSDTDLIDQVCHYGELAVDLDSTQPDAYETLAFAHLARKNHDAALQAAYQAVEYDPNFADAYISLADVLCFAGQPEAAMPAIEKAMRLNPKYAPNYLFAMGNAHRLLGKLSLAIDCLKRALADNPDHFVSHFILTVCYVESGEIELARVQAREILRISPNFSIEKSRERSPILDPEVKKRQYDALVQAGLT